MALPAIANLKELPVTNFKRCVICQASQKNVTLCEPEIIKDSTYINFLSCLRERTDLQDIKYITVYQRMEKEDQMSLKSKGATWHRNCYGQVTNREHIDRARDKIQGSHAEMYTTCDDQHPSTSSRVPTTRSALSVFNKEMCFFCQKRKSNDVLHKANVSKKLCEAVHILNNEALSIRFDSINRRRCQS